MWTTLGKTLLSSVLLASSASAAPSSQSGSAFQSRASGSGSQGRVKSSTGNGTASYNQSLRPQIHFSPSEGFMNDPNGLVVAGKPDNQTVHLYFQYNPTDTVAGNQHWGHATSKNFSSYEWENHAPALAPDVEGEGVFSGSAVIDRNNTSGFFDDSTEEEQRIVAIFTNHTDTEESQSIAYSKDGGYSYTKYDQNPVVTHKGHFQTQFRDPKVFWDEAHNQWVMAVAHTQEYQIGFYTSPDLKSWELASEFGPTGFLGFQYECPSIFQAPVIGGPLDGQKTWVMLVSNNPGAPQGGSFNQYFLGDWDGKKFTTNDTATRVADFGKDWYAAQTWDNTGDKAVAIGWASNWQYTQSVPTSPWRSVLSLPREIKVKYVAVNPLKKDYVMTMTPFETSSIKGKDLYSNKNGESPKLNQTMDLQGGNGVFEINATFSLSAEAYKNATTQTYAEMRIYAGKDKKQFLKVGMAGGEQGGIYIDRRKAGTKWADDNVWFNDRFSAHIEPRLEDGKSQEDSRKIYDFRLFVDRSISELYVNEGVAVGTVLHYWDDEAIPDALEVRNGDGHVKFDNFSVSALKSTWN
ncbi:unnamed protein product [Sympodiomycopsis kandeliae]